MTTLDNDLPERPLFLRAAQLVGHHKTRVWTAYVACTLIGGITLGLLDAPLLIIPAVVALLAAGALVMKLEGMHDRRLCEGCISSLPLNPSEAAARKDRPLRAVHWTNNRRPLFLLLVAFSIAVPVSGFLVQLRWRWHLPGSLPFILSGFAMLLVWLWFVRAFDIHRRLSPWCPYCRRRGGGGGLHMPSPEPAGSTGRRR